MRFAAYERGAASRMSFALDDNQIKQADGNLVYCAVQQDPGV
jgi:hypothetical protein